MYQIAIVEDERHFAQALQDYIVRYGGETDQEFNISQFGSGKEILSRCQWEPGFFDVILMDIQMEGMTGMEAAAKLRAYDQDVVLVFITNMAQFAIHGYQVGALDYVLKPLSYGTFKTRFARALARVDRHRHACIVLPCHDRKVQIEVRKIQYVEVSNRILCYHTEDGEFTFRGSLKKAEEELLHFHFIKGNYWYIANLLHVKEIGSKTLTVAGVELPLSRNSRQEVLEAFYHYVSGERRT